MGARHSRLRGRFWLLWTLGLLPIPYGYQYVGLVGGPIIIVIVASITFYSFFVLVDTKRYLVSKGRSPSSYAEVGFEVLGKKGLALVNVAIIGNQTGVLAAYQQFIGKNILHFVTPPFMPLSAWVCVWLVV